MKKVLFLLLPLFLFADIKFASSTALGEDGILFANNAAMVIEKELDLTLLKNTKSDIYTDEAALYALKNGIIKFTVVRKKLFDDMGLDYSDMRNYGFEALVFDAEFVLLAESRFFAYIAQTKKIRLFRQLEKLKN
jgi:hypothetical protein